MRTCTDASRFPLAAGQVATLRDAAGTRVECEHGLLWITQHGEGRDILLKPGEEFSLDRNGVTLVQALRASQVWLTETAPVPAGSPWWKRLGLALLGYFAELGMRRTDWRRAYRL